MWNNSWIKNSTRHTDICSKLNNNSNESHKNAKENNLIRRLTHALLVYWFRLHVPVAAEEGSAISGSSGSPFIFTSISVLSVSSSNGSSFTNIPVSGGAPGTREIVSWNVTGASHHVYLDREFWAEEINGIWAQALWNIFRIKIEIIINTTLNGTKLAPSLSRILNNWKNMVWQIAKDIRPNTYNEW